MGYKINGKQCLSHRPNALYLLIFVPLMYIHINMITNSSQFARDFLGSSTENLVSKELPRY